MKAKILNFSLIITAILLLAVVPQQAQESSDYVKSVVKYLASDELEGRLTGTEGNEKAAAFIIEQFKSIGLKPLTDGYRQQFELSYRKKPLGKSAVTLTKIVKRPGLPPDMWLKAKKKWTEGEQFMPVAVSSNGTAKGELAFVGYGITADEHHYDDYAGIDVKGKIVVIISDSADGQPIDERFVNYATLRYKARNAKEHGAAGIIFVKRLSDSANTFYKFNIGDITPGCGLPAIQVKRTEIAKYFPKKKNLYPMEMKLMETKQPQSFVLPDAEIEMTVELGVEKIKVSNVLAMLEGTEKPDEYIVIGAHFDHIGHGEIQIKRRSRWPKIYNGADDNSSGVAAMLELAKRFKAAPPKRSIIFIGFNAEEMGCIGSNYFVDNSPVALNKIKAMFNFDMVGRLKDNIIIFGVKSSKTLNSIVDLIAADSVSVAKNQETLGPSDHAAFNNKNIPALFFFSGTHEDYNTPRDDWNRINYKGLIKIVDFAEKVIRKTDAENEIDFVKQGQPKHGGHYKGKIKVSFGSIPDFARADEGFVVKGCRENSPCEKAGMQAGDILIEFNGKKVTGIRDFTMYLMEVNPGDVVKIIYKRDGKEITREVQLNAK